MYSQNINIKAKQNNMESKSKEEILDRIAKSELDRFPNTRSSKQISIKAMQAYADQETALLKDEISELKGKINQLEDQLRVANIKNY